MRRSTIGLVFLLLFCGHAWGYTPPAGFQKIAQKFSSDAFAVAPDGKVAVGTLNFSGGASISVFSSAADAASAALPVQSFTDPTFKSFGDLTFVDPDTLVFSENADNDTLYSAIISSGAVTPLAPIGSVPNAGGVAVSGATIYTVAANDPGTGALYTIPLGGGSANVQASSLGTGFLSGIALDHAGTILLTDSNDPEFAGNAGRLLRYDSTFSPLSSIDLSGGGGSGAYDIVVDSEGDLFITTGSTITEIPAGTTASQPFGTTFGEFAFISGLDFIGSGFEPGSGNGVLFVNALFGDEGGTIGITPIPEPAGWVLIGILLGLRPRRRNNRRTAASTSCRMSTKGSAFLALCLLGATAAHGDQFFASKVISSSPGPSQLPGFTDPQYALGPPRGEGNIANGTHVYNLGIGGSLTVGFDVPDHQRGIFDGPGADFIIFENAFLQNDDPSRVFAELMFVEVSSDNINFLRFPAKSFTSAPVGPHGVIDPQDARGFAGVTPVHANADTNSIDPFDPSLAGGDAYDLFALKHNPWVQSNLLDFSNVRFVRLVDVHGDGSLAGVNLFPIYDPTGFGIGGADVDAVAVIHGVQFPEPAGFAATGALIAIAIRRHRG